MKITLIILLWSYCSFSHAQCDTKTIYYAIKQIMSPAPKESSSQAGYNASLNRHAAYKLFTCNEKTFDDVKFTIDAFEEYIVSTEKVWKKNRNGKGQRLITTHPMVHWPAGISIDAKKSSYHLSTFGLVIQIKEHGEVSAYWKM